VSTGIHCPRCNLELITAAAEPIVVLACERCSGVWLGNDGCHLVVHGELPDHVTEAIRIVDGHDGEVADGGYRQAAAMPSGDRLRCPICSEPLEQVDTTEARHGIRVRLEVCAQDGSWFDRGEAWTLYQAASLKRLGAAFWADMSRRDWEWARRHR
jgi:Zn-finger nucleic acid-binding protein